MKILDLNSIFDLLCKQGMGGNSVSEEITTKRLPNMKLAIRIFALFVAFAGLAAASVSSINS